MITENLGGNIITAGAATYFAPITVVAEIPEFKPLDAAVEKFASAVATLIDEVVEKPRPEEVRTAARNAHMSRTESIL